MSKKNKLAVVQAPEKLLRLDIGCGPNTKEGFEGVDAIAFGQTYHWDVRAPWPIADQSVEEIHSSHFLEHLTGAERCAFFDEAHRVLIPDGKMLIICPHAFNICAYGDPTHQWPPVTEWTFQYTNEPWRKGNAPHVNMKCNFDFFYGYSTDGDIGTRNQEYQQFAIRHYNNAIRDIHVTMVKKPNL